MVIEKYLYYINKNKNICIYTPNIPLPLTLPPYPASCFIFINLWKHTLLDSDVFFPLNLNLSQWHKLNKTSASPLHLWPWVTLWKSNWNIERGKSYWKDWLHSCIIKKIEQLK